MDGVRKHTTWTAHGPIVMVCPPEMTMEIYRIEKDSGLLPDPPPDEILLDCIATLQPGEWYALPWRELGWIEKDHHPKPRLARERTD